MECLGTQNSRTSSCSSCRWKAKETAWRLRVFLLPGLSQCPDDFCSCVDWEPTAEKPGTGEVLRIQPGRIVRWHRDSGEKLHYWKWSDEQALGILCSQRGHAQTSWERIHEDLGDHGSLPPALWGSRSTAGGRKIQELVLTLPRSKDWQCSLWARWTAPHGAWVQDLQGI